MRFRNFIERTLYHGTIVDHEASIRKIGLFGQMGDFQNSAGYNDDTYGEPPEDEDEVIYMTDKSDLSKAVTAMVHHIGKKLEKDFHDVTDDDIRNHGLLCVMHDEMGPQDVSKRNWGEPTVGRRPLDKDIRGEKYPRGAEPGDYYASSRVPDRFLKGAALLRLLQRYGEWPRNWGEPGYKDRNKIRRGKFVAKGIADTKKYPLFKSEILNQVKKDAQKFPLRRDGAMQ